MNKKENKENKKKIFKYPKSKRTHSEAFKKKKKKEKEIRKKRNIKLQIKIQILLILENLNQ